MIISSSNNYEPHFTPCPTPHLLPQTPMNANKFPYLRSWPVLAISVIEPSTTFRFSSSSSSDPVLSMISVCSPNSISSMWIHFSLHLINYQWYISLLLVVESSLSLLSGHLQFPVFLSVLFLRLLFVPVRVVVVPVFWIVHFPEV